MAKVVLYNHEIRDGEEYPRGLKGEEIPLISRIISVVYTYDIMTNNRPYKRSMSKNKAMLE